MGQDCVDSGINVRTRLIIGAREQSRVDSSYAAPSTSHVVSLEPDKVHGLEDRPNIVG